MQDMRPTQSGGRRRGDGHPHVAAGEVIGKIALGDTIKREAPQVVRQLQHGHQGGWRRATTSAQHATLPSASASSTVRSLRPSGSHQRVPTVCTCRPWLRVHVPTQDRSPSPWRAPSFHPEPHPLTRCSASSQGRKHRSQRFVRGRACRDGRRRRQRCACSCTG